MNNLRATLTNLPIVAIPILSLQRDDTLYNGQNGLSKCDHVFSLSQRHMYVHMYISIDMLLDHIWLIVGFVRIVWTRQPLSQLVLISAIP